MKWLRELTRRLSMLVHRRQFDADLEEEMRLHLELRNYAGRLALARSWDRREHRNLQPDGHGDA